MNLSTIQKAARNRFACFPNEAPFNCPVLALLAEHEELAKVFAREDDDKRKAGARVNKALLEQVSARMLEIPEEVSRLTPRSFEGSVFQIMLAFGEADGLTWDDAENRERFHRLIVRALERLDVNATAFPATRDFLMRGEA